MSISPCHSYYFRAIILILSTPVSLRQRDEMCWNVPYRLLLEYLAPANRAVLRNWEHRVWLGDTSHGGQALRVRAEPCFWSWSCFLIYQNVNRGCLKISHHGQRHPSHHGFLPGRPNLRAQLCLASIKIPYCEGCDYNGKGAYPLPVLITNQTLTWSDSSWVVQVKVCTKAIRSNLYTQIKCGSLWHL